jgi:hypothetical protein
MASRLMPWLTVSMIFPENIHYAGFTPHVTPAVQLQLREYALDYRTPLLPNLS